MAVETQDHMIKCQSETRQAIRDDLIEALNEMCKKYNAPPEMTTAFVEGTKAWICNENIPNLKEIVPNASQQLQKTYK